MLMDKTTICRLRTITVPPEANTAPESIFGHTQRTKRHRPYFLAASIYELVTLVF